MKVVLLAGGFGSRISEESQFKPKPMIEIGGMPILWHIMKEYAYYGHTEFIICVGYKQEYIKEWFANYFLHNSDVTFDYRNGKNEMTVHQTNMEPWKVTVVDTGYNTMTGGRIKRIQKYVGNDVPVKIIFGQTYRLLQQAKAALVTSGTATLETALFRVPQAVCYYTPVGKLISFLRRHILKVKYISLVNLVADKEVVRELVADTMTVVNVRSELDALLNDEIYRGKIFQEYDRMIKILGPAGASHQAASKIIGLLSVKKVR